jgi:hypothetical protein
VTTKSKKGTQKSTMESPTTTDELDAPSIRSLESDCYDYTTDIEVDHEDSSSSEADVIAAFALTEAEIEDDEFSFTEADLIEDSSFADAEVEEDGSASSEAEIEEEGLSFTEADVIEDTSFAGAEVEEGESAFAEAEDEDEDSGFTEPEVEDDEFSSNEDDVIEDFVITSPGMIEDIEHNRLDMVDALDLSEADVLEVVDAIRQLGSLKAFVTAELKEANITGRLSRRYRTMEAASMRLQKEAKGYLDSLRGESHTKCQVGFG